MTTFTKNNSDIRVFIDTSAFIALLNPKDQYHHQIQNYLNEINQPLRGITTNLIFSELLTFFSRQGALKKVLQFQEKMLEDSNFKIIWAHEDLHRRACDILKKFQEHRLSFADAVSFTVMQDERLTHALAFDQDFKRAGFQMLP